MRKIKQLLGNLARYFRIGCAKCPHRRGYNILSDTGFPAKNPKCNCLRTWEL